MAREHYNVAQEIADLSSAGKVTYRLLIEDRALRASDIDKAWRFAFVGLDAFSESCVTIPAGTAAYGRRQSSDGTEAPEIAGQKT